jgi:hypothetical protein
MGLASQGFHDEHGIVRLAMEQSGQALGIVHQEARRSAKQWLWQHRCSGKGGRKGQKITLANISQQQWLWQHRCSGKGGRKGQKITLANISQQPPLQIQSSKQGSIPPKFQKGHSLSQQENALDRNQRATHSTIQFLAMQIPHKKVLVQRNNLQFAPPEVWHLPLADSETFRYSALQ